MKAREEIRKRQEIEKHYLKVLGENYLLIPKGTAKVIDIEKINCTILCDVLGKRIGYDCAKCRNGKLVFVEEK